MINNYSGAPMGITGRDWSPQHNGGPMIKTGSTRNHNRSRNKNGRWRKKRSDAGIPRNSL
jgi:hypothetical protein